MSYAQLRAALERGVTADARAAFASLPTADPSGGGLWQIPEAYARFLCLPTVTPTTDDTVIIDPTTLQNSTSGRISAEIEHEISEGGMGRIGGLGQWVGPGGFVHNYWSTMDLFGNYTFNEPHQHIV